MFELLSEMVVEKDGIDELAKVLVLDLSVDLPNDAAVVLCLSGELGAGKTTLVQAIARALGIGEIVTSPTFVISKNYSTEHDTFDLLIHMDAYRIDDVRELRPLHFDEMLTRPKTLICLEWPERIESALPPRGFARLSLSVVDENKRQIKYEKN